MKWPSFTVILSGIFMAYMAHSLWTIYSLFYPKPCPPKASCLKPYLARNPHLKMVVFTSIKENVYSDPKRQTILLEEKFDVHGEIEQEVNVSLPLKTRDNGTLYVHVFVCPKNEDVFGSKRLYYARSKLTTFMVPQSKTFNLMGQAEKKKEDAPSGQPVTHWRSRLTINVLGDDIAFDRQAIPGELYRFIRATPEGDYLPIVYIDELSNRIRDLMPVNESSLEMPLTVIYKPISVGKLRLWVNMQESLKTLEGLGFTEKDTDEVKAIFADTNFYLLILTFMVAALHMLFDFLAFKNDISYWRNRDTMVGLSTRVVVWRCVSTLIIFLYLLDEETSLLVLIPAGIGSIIEVWKVTKAFKVKVKWSGWKPGFEFGSVSDKEKETQDFDSQAMKYLSFVLYPLVLCGAVYSLIYTPHKSWYSWCIQSLVNGVYAFGFLFMLPQLFVNYKLKSVAHLPWRAFMYKAFNTFIDDIFAFIITMPTAHRLACFRDDVVFVIYLYQRWLYPVDKTRVNEFGQSFDENEGDSKKTK